MYVHINFDENPLSYNQFRDVFNLEAQFVEYPDYYLLQDGNDYFYF